MNKSFDVNKIEREHKLFSQLATGRYYKSDFVYDAQLALIIERLNEVMKVFKDSKYVIHGDTLIRVEDTIVANISGYEYVGDKIWGVKAYIEVDEDEFNITIPLDLFEANNFKSLICARIIEMLNKRCHIINDKRPEKHKEVCEGPIGAYRRLIKELEDAKKNIEHRASQIFEIYKSFGYALNDGKLVELKPTACLTEKFITDRTHIKLPYVDNSVSFYTKTIAINRDIFDSDNWERLIYRQMSEFFPNAGNEEEF